MARVITIDLDKALDLLAKRMARHEADALASARMTAGHPVADSHTRDIGMQFAGETRLAAALPAILEAATVKGK